MYTVLETTQIIEAYQKGESVQDLAARFHRSTKSIIGKLSREGVYVKQVYLSKSGELPRPKKELVAILASRLGLPLSSLEGLDKAPKSVLKTLAEAPFPESPI